MCRVALFNRQAAELLTSSHALEFLFGHLEYSFGGHGNGIAALWDDGRVRIEKGLHLTTSKAALRVERFAQQEASWMLFHTRRASSSGIANAHCHPFRAGSLVLAHNGHDPTFARLGRSRQMTDSECLATAWARLHLPVTELAQRSGVFMGFQHAAPFVIKGSRFSDLLAAWQQESGALLFASEPPALLDKGIFDQVVMINRIEWCGRELDASTLDAQPYRPDLLPRHAWSSPLWDSSPWYPDPAEETARDEAEQWMDDEDQWEMETEDLAEDDPPRFQTMRERDWRQGKQVDDPTGLW